MRFVLVLFSGGVIGAVLCMVLGAGIPAAVAGALVGGVCAFLAYDPTEIRAWAPAAARAAFGGMRRFRDDVTPIVRFALRPRFFLWMCMLMGVVFCELFDIRDKRDVASLVTLASLFVFYLTFSVGAHLVLLLFAIALHALVGWLPWVGEVDSDLEGVLLFSQKDNSLIYGDGTEPFVPLLRRQVNQYFGVWAKIVVIFATGIPKGVWLLPRWCATFAAMVATGCCRFAWNLFVDVHREEQRMAFVDTALGVVGSYAFLRLAYGDAFLSMPPAVRLSFIALAAAFALGLGLVNCHLVATRVLGLDPARTRR